MSTEHGEVIAQPQRSSVRRQQMRQRVLRRLMARLLAVGVSTFHVKN